MYQRPQHLLTRAAQSFRVLFFEEPLWEEIAGPELRLSEEGGVTVVTPILPYGPEDAETAQQRLLDGLLAERGGGELILWYYTPMALGFSEHLAPDLVVHDCMDELSAFRFAPPGLLARERELLDRADLIFTGGESLYAAKRARHPDVHCFPSSIDAAHFRRARETGIAEPADQASIPHPRLGFFGVIDERMDLDLVAEMAALRPDWQFVMIGPVVKIDEASLPRRANIHWLGGKSYGELPDYLAGWEVGLMPFAMNEATRFISPTKTPEFLAAGVPVVSTPVVDVARAYGDEGLVEIAANAAEMAAKAGALLTRPKGPWLERVDRRLAGLSWDRTFEAMHRLMRERLQEREAGAGDAAPGTAAHV